MVAAAADKCARSICSIFSLRCRSTATTVPMRACSPRADRQLLPLLLLFAVDDIHTNTETETPTQRQNTDSHTHSQRERERELTHTHLQKLRVQHALLRYAGLLLLDKLLQRRGPQPPQHLERRLRP